MMRASSSKYKPRAGITVQLEAKRRSQQAAHLSAYSLLRTVARNGSRQITGKVMSESKMKRNIGFKQQWFISQDQKNQIYIDIIKQSRYPPIYKLPFFELNFYYELYSDLYLQKIISMHQRDQFPTYDSNNYEGLNETGALIRISHSMRHSRSEEEIYLPEGENIEESRVKKVKCKCNLNYNKEKSCCTCGVVVCPGPHTSTTSRISDQLIKGDSRIEYVEFQKKAIDYYDQEKYQLKEKRELKSDMIEEKFIDYVPREVTVTDYYAVEHLRFYIPEIVQQKQIVCEPVSRINIKKQYIPVNRQIVHYPVHSHDDEAPRNLGLRPKPGPKVYQNISEDRYEYWQREYGYKRGESVSELNRKIRQKDQRDKNEYFRKKIEQIKERYRRKQPQTLERKELRSPEK